MPFQKMATQTLKMLKLNTVESINDLFSYINNERNVVDHKTPLQGISKSLTFHRKMLQSLLSTILQSSQQQSLPLASTFII
jgi:hypothetical protein